jgi:hypothetical protein
MDGDQDGITSRALEQSEIRSVKELYFHQQGEVILRKWAAGAGCAAKRWATLTFSPKEIHEPTFFGSN